MIDRSALTVIDGDARIACRRLQEVLGYSAVRHIHDLIRRHREELEDFGRIFADESKKSSGRGRPTISYYLNEHQATAICLWAETVKARAARKLIVEVFTAWRKGQLDQVAVPEVDPFGRMAGRAGHAADHLQAIAAMPLLAREATHLPIWKNGRRPNWWSHYELRAFVTESHRQMTLAQCIDQAGRRFGVCMSLSSLQRYWAQLDRVVGPRGAA